MSVAPAYARLGRRRATVVGTSKRYADAVDAQMGERILVRAAAVGPLQTLSVEELQLDVFPCTTDPRPKPAMAWVRFGDAAFKVKVEACMWTPKAVAVRFNVADREYRCWVWQGAVEDVARIGI
jgi:hypothetical protein